MWYGFLADLVVAFHFAYVGFVVLGQLLILAGLAFGWSWVRNLWFRLAHLLAIGIVALEAVWDIPCPLTVWERELSILAGRQPGQGTFIGRWLDYLVFYNFDSRVFTTAYISFALLVLATFVLAAPRWR